MKRAGIEDFRWHDARHTWASWLTQNGVPLNALQEMGAWQSAEMVRRYAHLAPEQFLQHARVVDYLFKTVLRGRVSYDDGVLILPRARDELSDRAPISVH